MKNLEKDIWFSSLREGDVVISHSEYLLKDLVLCRIESCHHNYIKVEVLASIKYFHILNKKRKYKRWVEKREAFPTKRIPF